MIRAVLIALICMALASGTALAFTGLDGGFGKLGARGKGKAAAPLTNLRITNDGSFRIINTGDNRAVSP